MFRSRLTPFFLLKSSNRKALRDLAQTASSGSVIYEETSRRFFSSGIARTIFHNFRSHFSPKVSSFLYLFFFPFLIIMKILCFLSPDLETLLPIMLCFFVYLVPFVYGKLELRFIKFGILPQFLHLFLGNENNVHILLFNCRLAVSTS